jgi:tricorn protease
MSSDEHRITRSVYVTVLSKDEKSPLSPESDEEKAKEEKKPDSDKDKAKDSSAEKDKTKGKDKAADAADKDKEKDAKDKDKKDESVVVKVDIDGIGQRILSLPIPAKNYLNLLSGKSGILFLSEGPLVVTEDDQPNVSQTIQKFDLSKRKVDKVLEDVNDFTVSFDGEKILYRKGDSWATASADDGPGGSGPPKPGFGPLKLDDWEVYVEPRAIWKQIYNVAHRTRLLLRPSLSRS